MLEKLPSWLLISEIILLFKAALNIPTCSYKLVFFLNPFIFMLCEEGGRDMKSRNEDNFQSLKKKTMRIQQNISTNQPKSINPNGLRDLEIKTKFHFLWSLRYKIPWIQIWKSLLILGVSILLLLTENLRQSSIKWN